MPSLLHRQAEAGGHRRPGGALRAAVRQAGQEVGPDRLDQLRAVKLGALIDSHWGKEGVQPRLAPFALPGGAAALDEDAARGWVLIDDGSARRFGAAWVWAWRRGVGELHVLVEGAAGAGVVARRSAELAAPPAVWAVSGRALTPAPVAAPAVSEEPFDPTWAELLRAHGVSPVVEHGELRGEVLGLEVARVVGGRLEVGVGRHDRHARAELWGDFDPGGALDQVVAAVTAHRRAGTAAHPANTLGRSRWLRAVVCDRPSLVGAARLAPMPPPLPLPDLTDNGAVPCMGDGLMVVCSTGVDVDLVPSAADARRLYQPEARLVIVVPAGDDHPATLAFAAALVRPAEMRTVPRGWEGLISAP